MRKVLSFVLVLSLVLGSFSMAFAADSKAGLTDVAGNANADAIQVAYDLGIVTGNPDGTFQPDKAVNRAEFAAMITRALAIPDSALAGYTSTTFKDTVGYGWAVPYLAFCQSKGIMLGDGAGNVMPGRTITVNEAVTMALRAIGYTQNSALLVGAWPANYVSIAQNEDLYDKVASDTTVNKASAAQIIYNLLTVQKVAVNADGDTDFLWKDRAGTVAANLLNTNLGCTEKEDVILGVDYDYDSSVINITDKIGAYGTAYLNDDDEVVAFTVDSTALTGKVESDGKFKADGVKYSFSTNSFTTRGATILNTDVIDDDLNITRALIETFDGNADDGSTVTINVELSGKNIKNIYSVVAWAASKDDKAGSDVQEDIADNELLGYDFVETDDGDIDLTSFQLVGVTSLEDIEKDDVVYVYADNNNDIRKVAVGKETVEGTVTETQGNDTVAIDGKDYKIAKLGGNPVLDIPSDVDVDSDGVFYLDAFGKIYDFDGSGKVNTYGVIKAATAATPYDNFKMRLFKSDGTTSTVYLADDTDEIDYVSGAADMPVAITQGALIGYSLNADGDIDEIDDTFIQASAGDLYFQSTKVIIDQNTTSYSIDANAVVFTYATSTSLTSEYDTAKLSEVKKGTITGAAWFILNDDGKVAALFIEDDNVDLDTDYVYGVFNVKRNVKNSDGDPVFRFTGLIDGSSFSKLTDKDSGFITVTGVFGVYEIEVDTNDVIKDIIDLSARNYDGTRIDAESGYIVKDIVIKSLNGDKTVITDTTDKKWTVDDDAVVYKYNPTGGDEKYTVSNLSKLRPGYTVSLYDTKGEDVDGVASVIVYMED